MAGIRPLDYEDPEKDPEYAAALERYYAANFDAPGATEYRAAGAPARPADVGGIRVRPAAMLADMAKGTNGGSETPEQAQARRSADLMARAAAGEDLTPLANPNPARVGTRVGTERMTPTPGGEALAFELQRAARGSPALPGDELPDRPSAGQVLAQSREPGVTATWADRPRGPNLLAAGVEAIQDRLNPLPDVEMPLPGMPPPAAAPQAPARPRVGMAREVTTPNVTRIASAAPPVPSGDITPDHPAVRRIVEEASSRTRVAPDTATAGPSDLEAALQESSQRRLLAGLTRAGATAVGGGRGPAYDALDEGADRPLQELALRRADLAQQQGRAAQAADADPASPQSQMARALAARVAPGLEREPWFQNASYTSLSRGPLGKMLEQAGDIQRERIKAQAQVDKARAKAKGVGLGGLKRADLERFTQKAAKETQGFADMQVDLETVLRAAQSPDVAGIGPGAGLVPDVFTSAEGTENRRAARRLVENLLKAQSGLAASDREQVRKLASTSLSDRASDADWIAGAKELARFAQKGMRAREAAYPPEAIELLEQRGGTTSKNILPTESGGAPLAKPGAGLGRAPASEADISQMSDDELRAFLGGG